LTFIAFGTTERNPQAVKSALSGPGAIKWKPSISRKLPCPYAFYTIPSYILIESEAIDEVNYA
jgi:hypothetical protein